MLAHGKVRGSIDMALLQKYRHPELDDASVDGLIRYFQLDSYAELVKFLKMNRSGD